VLSITWQTSDLCNFRCDYCNPGNYGGQQLNLQTDVYKDNLARILDHFGTLGYTQVKLFLSGGEPSLWKPLPAIYQCLSDLLPNALTVAINTNLSRPLAWWQHNYHMFDDVVCSYHPGWAQHDNFVSVAQYLQTRVNYLAVRMMMSETHWESQLSRADEIYDSLDNVYLEYVPILAEMSTAAHPYDYIDQKKVKWLHENNLRIKQNAPKPDNRIGTAAILEHYSNGTVQPLNSNRLAAERLNFFSGWQCDIGSSINIAINGDITLASCGISGIIGNINKKLEIDHMLSSVICNKHHCHCGTDICIPKRILHDQ